MIFVLPGKVDDVLPDALPYVKEALRDVLAVSFCFSFSKSSDCRGYDL